MSTYEHAERIYAYEGCGQCGATRPEDCTCSADPTPHKPQDYRLTADDEARICARLREVRNEWEAQGHATLSGADAEALVRIGAHAIGCSLHDLRDCEIDWLRASVADLDGWV